LKKYEIVKKNTDFNDIINKGKFFKNNFYVIYYVDSNEEYPKFGLAVSKKCGKAVTRNKIKRQLRMIIDSNKYLFCSNKSYIIMVRNNILKLSFGEMEKKLVELLTQKGKINEKI